MTDNKSKTVTDDAVVKKEDFVKTENMVSEWCARVFRFSVLSFVLFLSLLFELR